MDFTLQTYKNLLLAFKQNKYKFITVKQFFSKNISDKKIVIMRHDIDRLPENALHTAKLESALDLKATYYFRTLPVSFNEKIIRKINELGHEIGYHYENMDVCKGNIKKAWDNFCTELDKLRRITDIKTICMHGSPLSKWDNRRLWDKYNYQDLGIIAEPYFDFNFDKIFYITDTGRKWDGYKVSIRDKINTQMQNHKKQTDRFHKTYEIIKAVESNQFASKVLITTHPERWTNNYLLWLKELIVQNLKNSIKYLIVKASNRQ